MNNDANHPAPASPLRKPIILIGAPSGAGKTMLSKKIMAGELPLFSELCGSAPDEITSYPLKILPEDLPRDRTLIIECSTYRFDRLTAIKPWNRLLALIRESELLVHVNVDVSKRTIVRQYFRRIFTEPKRMHVFYRMLQFSKYQTALIYMLTNQLSRANEAWYTFGLSLASETPSRVAIVRALRIGTGYELLLEAAPAQERT